MENTTEEIQSTGKLKELVKSRNFRRSLIAMLIGSSAGFLYYYFGELDAGKNMETVKALMSLFWGGLMGLFIVNSPCARGRC